MDTFMGRLFNIRILHVPSLSIWDKRAFLVSVLKLIDNEYYSLILSKTIDVGHSSDILLAIHVFKLCIIIDVKLKCFDRRASLYHFIS